MSEQTRGAEGNTSTEYIDLVVELTFENKEYAAEFAKETSWKAFQDITADLSWCLDVAAAPTCVRGNERRWMIAVWKNRLLVHKDFTDYLLWLLGKHPELHGVRIFYQHKESPHIELFDWHHTRPNEVSYWLCQVPAAGRCHYMMAKDTTGLIHNMECLEDLYGGSCYTMHKDLPLMRVHKAQTLGFEVSCDTCQRLKGHMTCEHHSQDIEEPAKMFCDDWKPRVVDLDSINEFGTLVHDTKEQIIQDSSACATERNSCDNCGHYWKSHGTCLERCFHVTNSKALYCGKWTPREENNHDN